MFMFTFVPVPIYLELSLSIPSHPIPSISPYPILPYPILICPLLFPQAIYLFEPFTVVFRSCEATEILVISYMFIRKRRDETRRGEERRGEERRRGQGFVRLLLPVVGHCRALQGIKPASQSSIQPHSTRSYSRTVLHNITPYSALRLRAPDPYHTTVQLTHTVPHSPYIHTYIHTYIHSFHSPSSLKSQSTIYPISCLIRHP